MSMGECRAALGGGYHSLPDFLFSWDFILCSVHLRVKEEKPEPGRVSNS